MVDTLHSCPSVRSLFIYTEISVTFYANYWTNGSGMIGLMTSVIPLIQLNLHLVDIPVDHILLKIILQIRLFRANFQKLSDREMFSNRTRCEK